MPTACLSAVVARRKSAGIKKDTRAHGCPSASLLFAAATAAALFLLVGFSGGATAALVLIFGVAARRLGTAFFVFHSHFLN